MKKSSKKVDIWRSALMNIAHANGGVHRQSHRMKRKSIRSRVIWDAHNNISWSCVDFGHVITHFSFDTNFRKLCIAKPVLCKLCLQFSEQKIYTSYVNYTPQTGWRSSQVYLKKIHTNPVKF